MVSIPLHLINGAQPGLRLHLGAVIHGAEVETVTAPARGVFVRSTTLSTVSRGERAATLGPP